MGGFIFLCLAVIALLAYLCVAIWTGIASEMPELMIPLSIPVIHTIIIVRSEMTGFGAVFKKLFRSTFIGYAVFMLISAIASAIAGLLNIVLGLLGSALIVAIVSPLPALIGTVIVILVNAVRNWHKKDP